MVFFDLSIPYTDLSPADRSTRAKLVTKALELGYSGVAYNRTIKGVMSDRDRCSIPLLPLSSLLKHSPHLTSAVAFHRDLLGVPRATPFRQYTRLTVCAETPAQAQVLNSGNPILKTYDLVAVKPMNQSAFDQACEKLEVDIIAIDFSEKLPFRLKQPMVKAAIERKVYFELTYANLIVDVQTRRQVITNAKLLVDWTRGKNLIISSAAPSANEFRGPYDVANLMSLLGLSMERAKAAISRNCRTLLSSAVRKKHYHKGAIRIEILPSGQEADGKKPWSSESYSWDPISSGEGDLLLDDLAKAFSGTKISKTVKPIDFTSIIDSTPSLGFRVNDATSERIGSAVELNARSVATEEVSEHRLYSSQPGKPVICDTLLKQQRFESVIPQKLYSSCDIIEPVNNFMEIEESIGTTGVESNNRGVTDGITTIVQEVPLQKCSIANTYDNMEIEVPTITIPTDPAETDGITRKIHDVQTQKTLTTGVVTDATETETAKTTGEEPKNPDEIDGFTTKVHDVRSQKCLANCELNAVPPHDNLTLCAFDIGLDLACNPDSKVQVPTNYQDSDIPAIDREEANSSRSCEILSGKEGKFLPMNSALNKDISEMKELRESGDMVVVPANQDPVMETNGEMRVTNAYSVESYETPETKLDEEKHGKAHGELSYSALVQSESGKSRGKRKKPHQATFLPLKRLLHATTFKKARKSKRTKMA